MLASAFSYGKKDYYLGGHPIWEVFRVAYRLKNANGSWHYSTDGQSDFVDHFHTCFIVKALAKIEQLTGDSRCRSAIERGVHYYVRNLVDAPDLPVPFSKRPCMTVYRRELYDYAECVNVGVLLNGRFAEVDRILCHVVSDVLERW